MEIDAHTHSTARAAIVQRDDPRYAELAGRGSKRFTGTPDAIRVVCSTEQVVHAVQDAVNERLRLAVRSGGHCLEGFVSDAMVRVVIDTSLMTRVTYDPAMHAFAVEPGARLGDVYRTLFVGWGVTLPAGVSPNVGVGGHVLGGGFGYLSRLHGLAADHLYAVEVVVVDETGTARSVVATREPTDPYRDLWWAHTGGGGGNFGIVTRYWFRTPGVAGSDPTALLPTASASVLTFSAAWDWSALDEAAFTRLVQNFGAWCERNSAPDSPAAALYSTLVLPHRRQGAITLTGLVIGSNQPEHLIEEHLAEVNAGVGATHTCATEPKSWLAFALDPAPGLAAPGLEHATFKLKDALRRTRFTTRQCAVAYGHLSRSDQEIDVGWGMATYGGRINAVPPEATASGQRDATMTTSVTAGWADPADEERSLAAVRAFYRDLFADTGGVPLPGEASSGALINHPDIDVADPAWNTSGVPWPTIYYRDNYTRLQQVKARWDPRNVFHHALSIRPTVH
jgi:FAD/FMN-containing dehydrogenase